MGVLIVVVLVAGLIAIVIYVVATLRLERSRVAEKALEHRQKLP